MQNVILEGLLTTHCGVQRHRCENVLQSFVNLYIDSHLNKQDVDYAFIQNNEFKEITAFNNVRVTVLYTMHKIVR